MLFYIFRVVTHVVYESGSFTPFDTIYQRYVAVSTFEPEKKKEFSMVITSLFADCETDNRRVDGIKRRGFNGISLLHTPKIPAVSTCTVGNVELIHTGDIKDGSYVAFTLNKPPTESGNTSPAAQVSLFGKPIAMSSLVSHNASEDIVKAVLSRVRLCRGAAGGRTVWTRTDCKTKYLGNISKNCSMILTGKTNACAACSKHKHYLQGKENLAPNQQSVPDAAVTSSPSPSMAPESDNSVNSPIDDPNEENETSISQKLTELKNILIDIGIPGDRIEMMTESIRNEVCVKTKRRWSQR